MIVPFSITQICVVPLVLTFVEDRVSLWDSDVMMRGALVIPSPLSSSSEAQGLRTSGHSFLVGFRSRLSLPRLVP